LELLRSPSHPPRQNLTLPHKRVPKGHLSPSHRMGWAALSLRRAQSRSKHLRLSCSGPLLFRTVCSFSRVSDHPPPPPNSLDIPLRLRPQQAIFHHLLFKLTGRGQSCHKYLPVFPLPSSLHSEFGGSARFVIHLGVLGL